MPVQLKLSLVFLTVGTVKYKAGYFDFLNITSRKNNFRPYKLTESYRQTDIKRTTGIQSRVITIPGAVVDFVEKIFHPEPRFQYHRFQVKRMPGIQIPL